MTFTRAVAVVLAIATLSPAAALAGGEIYTREAAYASVGKCAGRILERFHTGGDVHGSYSAVTIACEASPGQADWVLISRTDCYDIDSTETCATREARTVPRMEIDPDFWDAARQKPPFRMDYQLVKWGFGRDCRAVEQPVSAGYDYTASAWLCAALEVGDGTRDAQSYETLAPSKFNLRDMRTEGQAILAPSRGEDFSDQLPGEFIIDRTAYGYNYAD